MNLALPIIGAVSTFLCLLLAAFLLLVPGPLRRANRLLAGFMLLTAIDVAGWMAPLLPPAARDLFLFRIPLAYLQMPLLYAYMERLCFPDRQARWNRIAAGLAVILSALSLLPRAAARTGLADPALGAADLLANSVALHVQYYLYAALMLALLVAYRRARRDAGETGRSPVSVWIGTMLAVSVAAHSLVLAKSWAGAGGHVLVRERLDIAVGLIAILIISALILTAMLRQPLFVGLPAPRRRMEPPDAAGEAALARLDHYMAEQQPFLDPGLTIRALARRTGMGQRDLSALLNRHRGVHFFDYVNRHRVDRAAEMLASDAHRSATILDIAFRAGFNSKSSFNTAFAKHRGETPSDYRARVQDRAGPEI